MQLLIQNALIIDESSPHNEARKDILIENGIIQRVEESIYIDDIETISGEDLCVSVGWLDIGTQMGDPGWEHREDLNSVARAAAMGGYTAIACFPNTSPSIQDKSQVQYVVHRSQNSLVEVLPVGAITRDTKGKEITEMYDMKKAGAVAFSDGVQSIQNNGMMLRALQYVTPFSGLVINHPSDEATAHSGQMHEGYTSTSLGLKGIPSLSEEMMVFRDLQLLEYTQSRLHIYNISTEKSVELIRDAKRRGLQVTASVAALNLSFLDEDLADFNTHLKVLPPLRTADDREALIAGLKDGTIDCITSNHRPWNSEAKDLEFLYAKFGAIGLGSTFGLVYSSLGDEFSLTEIIDKMAVQPREILRLPRPSIQVGETANLTLFNPNEVYTYKESMIGSISKNSPLIGEKLKGKICGVINGVMYKLY